MRSLVFNKSWRKTSPNYRQEPLHCHRSFCEWNQIFHLFFKHAAILLSKWKKKKFF
jgi:hypothetical protein